MIAAGRAIIMIFRVLAAALCLLGLPTVTAAQPASIFADPAASLKKARPIQLARMVVNIKRGEKIGRAKYAALCMYPEDLMWKTGSIDLKINQFESLFRDRMNEAGFVVAGDPRNLFSDENSKSVEYLVGGSIERIDMQVCYRNVNANETDYEKSSGMASIDVSWQIYSSLERKVVATIKITGKAARPKGSGGGAFGLIFDAFEDAAGQLASDAQFTEIFTGPEIDRAVARTPPSGLVSLQFNAAAPAVVALSNVVASTAVIFANGGEGSGFLISADGYILTNHHVVGGAQFVKVRWSDGNEVLGEVIRSDQLRDVALLKADPKGHKPLALRSTAVSIGEDVYAVGAPTGEKFRNTVTKGIVSALRIYNGFNFIQSDVGVTHGNSGGPIVDTKGQVIGLTDLGFDDAPMINLFIPIDEALGFLGLKVAAAK